MARILVIEDETDLREIIVAELNDMGHETIEAADGQQGLQQILSSKPDLILADINMPKVNGYQLRCQLQKNHPQHAAIPFVFVSAFADEEDIADGLIVGADHYLTKPINFDQLEGWINNFVN
jgi:DNA-binding response OmpR family regulator